jgi:regulator of PEP synthase PpsR (kinase-PPPase family)
MSPKQALSDRQEVESTLQDRIEQMKQEKAQLLDEWSQAMKRAYHVPVPYRRDVLHAVGRRYGDLVDAVESHITTLKASRGEFAPRLERLLLRTGGGA